MDGCFGHRRYDNNAKDAPSLYPHDCFLTKGELEEAEAHVNICRGRFPSSQSTSGSMDTALHSALKPDAMEPGLPLPTSAYEGCERSYVAADERNRKAPTGAFAVTGVMGLVCRHDRVIYLADITTAGEKQFYAVALLQRLFKGLPEKWKVGVLYDVACQLHRSVKKVSEFCCNQTPFCHTHVIPIIVCLYTYLQSPH